MRAAGRVAARRLTAATLATVLGAALALALPTAAAHAAARPLALRYALTGYLGVEQAGDTLLSCVPGSAAAGEPCAAAQAGGLVGNDDFTMSYVDTDGAPGTFNSSTAQLIAPPGAAVAFAGLYWGGDAGTGNDAGITGCRSAPSANQVTVPPAPGRADQVLVNVGGSGYVGVGATTFDTLASSLGGGTFQGFADITRLFAHYSGGSAATTIPVTVANAQLAQGRNCSGGWTVLLVYAYPGPEPTYAPGYRSLQLFDGLATAAPGAPVSAAATGFRVATDGAPVAGQVGLVLYDGDRGSAGSQLSVNGVPASDGIGDSTVAGSGYGVPMTAVGAVNPSYGNDLGYDSRVVDLPDGAPAPGVTGASASVAAGAGQLTVGALALVSRVDPLLAIARTVTRADGSDPANINLTPGTRLRYSLQLQALVPITGLALTDPLPAGLTPVDASLTLDGAPVPPGAGSLAGGTATLALPVLAPGTPTVLSYDVTVAATAPAGVPLVSRAEVHYTAGGAALSGYSPQVSVLANRVDLALTQTANAPKVAPGQPALVTITVRNQGPVPASGVTVADPVPPGLVVISASTAQGSYDAASGAWSVGALAPAASAVLKLTIGPGSPPTTAPSAVGTPTVAPTATADAAPPTWAVTNTAEISGADQPDVDSLPGDGLAGEDDQASVALSVTGLAPVASADPSPDGILAGAARPAELRVNNVITVLAALLGAALILIGGMVLVSARRRHRY